MIRNNDSGSFPFDVPGEPKGSAGLLENTVAICTVLSILQRIKDQLGLEAMLEYMDYYIDVLEKNKPDFEKAVNQALLMVSVKRMYKDAFSRETE